MFELSVDAEQVERLGARITAAGNARQLRKQLTAEIRDLLDPIVVDQRRQLMAMTTLGTPHRPALRAAIVRKIRIEVRTAGRAAGARIRVRKTGMPRGFADAPHRLNRRQGWRHPAPRTRRRDGSWTDPSPSWVAQLGKPGWFDDPARDGRDEARNAIRNVVLRWLDDTTKG